MAGASVFVLSIDLFVPVAAGTAAALCFSRRERPFYLFLGLFLFAVSMNFLLNSLAEYSRILGADASAARTFSALAFGFLIVDPALLLYAAVLRSPDRVRERRILGPVLVLVLLFFGGFFALDPARLVASPLRLVSDWPRFAFFAYLTVSYAAALAIMVRDTQGSNMGRSTEALLGLVAVGTATIPRLGFVVNCEMLCSQAPFWEPGLHTYEMSLGTRILLWLSGDLVRFLISAAALALAVRSLHAASASDPRVSSARRWLMLLAGGVIAFSLVAGYAGAFHLPAAALVTEVTPSVRWGIVAALVSYATIRAAGSPFSPRFLSSAAWIAAVLTGSWAGVVASALLVSAVAIPVAIVAAVILAVLTAGQVGPRIARALKGDTWMAPEIRIQDRFVVERVIGRGGGGRALLARDTTLDRRVVLKEIPVVDAWDESIIAREARLAGGIARPGVIRVYDVIRDGAHAYIVMEHATGGSLSDRIHRGPLLSPAEARELLSNTLAGLEAVHASGVLHRDLKPSNLLLGEDGFWKVADFGTARRADDPPTVGAGFGAALAGTPKYMAPEQQRGHADPRTDLYGLAAAVWEGLAGGPFPEQKEIVSMADPKLARILARALEPDPHQRFADAASMHAALEPEPVRATGGESS